MKPEVGNATGLEAVPREALWGWLARDERRLINQYAVDDAALEIGTTYDATTKIKMIFGRRIYDSLRALSVAGKRVALGERLVLFRVAVWGDVEQPREGHGDFARGRTFYVSAAGDATHIVHRLGCELGHGDYLTPAEFFWAVDEQSCAGRWERVEEDRIEQRFLGEVQKMPEFAVLPVAAGQG